MGANKKQLLVEQVEKIDGILSILKDNFDIENEIPEEYSFLDIVKKQLADYANQ